MKVLKFIGQVLSALLYTRIFTGLYYIITVLPLSWVLSLPTKTMIIVMFLIGGFLETLIAVLQTILLLPYNWIVKQNKVALIITIALMAVNLIANCVLLWINMLNVGGTLPVVFSVIITVMIIQALFFAIPFVISIYEESKNNY